MDVLVDLAIHGFWIPAIPAGMTQLSLSWRVWVFTPSQRFDCGVVLNIMPEFKRSGRVE